MKYASISSDDIKGYVKNRVSSNFNQAAFMPLERKVYCFSDILKNGGIYPLYEHQYFNTQNNNPEYLTK